MKKNKGNILLPIISVIAILALVAAGYFYWKTQQNPGQPLGPYTPPKIQTPNPKIPTDENADWKTYTDSQYIFSLKYPSSLFPQTSQGDKNTGELEIFKLDTSTKGYWGPHALEGVFYIKIYPFNQNLQQTLTPGGGFTVSPITISGISAQKGVRTEQIPGISSPDTVVIVSNNKYSYLISYPNTDFSGSHDKLFDQILATFKFTSNVSNSANIVNITLRLKDWYFQKGTKVYTYKISYDKLAEDKEQTFKATSYGSNEFDSYVEIMRDGAKLNIVPRPEGGNDLAEINVPEVVTIMNSKISNKPIFRIIDKANTQYIRYTYSDNYEAQCSTNNLSKACSTGIVGIGGEYYKITCQANPDKISNCDEIVKSLDISFSQNIQ